MVRDGFVRHLKEALEALKDGAQFRGRGGIRKRVKDVSAQGAFLDLDRAFIVGIREDVFRAADRNPKGVLQFAVVVHHLNGSRIFPPNNGPHDRQGDLAVVRVVIGAGHHTTQIFLKTVDIGDGGGHAEILSTSQVQGNPVLMEMSATWA